MYGRPWRSSSSIECLGLCGFYTPTYLSSIPHRVAVDLWHVRLNSRHWLTKLPESPSTTHPSGGALANMCSYHVRVSLHYKTIRSPSRRSLKTARSSSWSKRIPGQQGASSNTPRNRRAWLIQQQGMVSRPIWVTVTDHPSDLRLSLLKARMDATGHFANLTALYCSLEVLGQRSLYHSSETSYKAGRKTRTRQQQVHHYSRHQRVPLLVMCALYGL